MNYLLDRDVFVDEWFVIPFLALVGLLNLTHVSPMLADWTIVSVFGSDASVELGSLLIALYSVGFAVLGGLCCYYGVPGRRHG